MSNERWKNWLGLIKPLAEKMVDSLGRIINHADVLGAPLLISSREGRSYRTFWSGTIPSGETYYFALAIPAGVQVYGIVRSTVVFDGRADPRFIVGGSWTATDYDMAGNNFDETAGAAPAQCSLVRTTDYDGLGSPRDSGAPLISPTTGPVRTPSVQSSASAHPRFDSSTPPVFAYTAVGGAVDLWLDIIWEERPVN